VPDCPLPLPLPLTLDSLGCLCREQKKQKERERIKRLEDEEWERRQREERVVAKGGGGRKQRLALPGGRGSFNKADLASQQRAEQEEEAVQERMARYLDSQPAGPEPEKEEQEEEPHEEEEAVSEADAASREAAELVEKLEYFRVGEEKVGPLKTLAIKLEVASPRLHPPPSTL
jgi:hypothetical protein